MKTILLASVLALAAASAAIAPTQAETMIVKKTDQTIVKKTDNMHKKNDRRHIKTHCRTKLVTHWRHHRKVVEKVKVCG